MSNKDVENLLKQEKIYKWEVAKRLGIHESSFCRWWREQLSQEQIQQVLAAVEQIKNERRQKGE